MTGPAVVLAIDPGREKCGLAVLAADGTVLARRVVAAMELIVAAKDLAGRYAPQAIVVGDRTASASVRRALAQGLPDLPAEVVPEAGTTLEARRLYFADHPPRGWRRFVPLSLQVPPEPYDDYAAVALGRRFLSGRREGARQ
ncbi:MAG TPA: pre-16S rRNA-processing nuclease YqgF [bacterium]|nr:pre-16S rRNA-processing nuclease YqgF [bacterium]